MDYHHELIMCIVNAGYSEAVMDAAREFGARGGTVIHARGTANSEAEKLFNISIQPEKEIVMIIVEIALKEQILHGLYQKVGLQSAGQGIAFCLPVEDVVGLSGAKPLIAKTLSAEPSTPKAADAAAEPRTPQQEEARQKSLAIAEAEIAMDKERLLAELQALKQNSDNK